MKTQKEIILDHLLNKGSITSLECVYQYQIVDLQSIIRDLRNEGYKIEDNWIKSEKGKRFKQYFIKENN